MLCLKLTKWMKPHGRDYSKEVGKKKHEKEWEYKESYLWLYRGY